MPYISDIVQGAMFSANGKHVDLGTSRAAKFPAAYFSAGYVWRLEGDNQLASRYML